ncbi:prepilin-type N-terminal cleavage/methylation domain-containing protein [bacterium]|nr:prepilin-type N-terminal cleavage/methylation domain-containing protein [bacterium]
MRNPLSRGFTLVECMFGIFIASVVFLSTILALGYARIQNEVEQERIRAHQIISQKLEIERYQLFTWTASESTQTIWDNETPDDTSDDTAGTLEIIVRDPVTGAILTMAPDPARLIEIEATLSWSPRVARMQNRVLRETVITCKAP